MGRYSIKELEKLSGIKAHTIRIWEKRHHLIEPQRTKTNIRFYSDDDLKKIINVSLLNTSGIRISRIASMSADEMSKKILEISDSQSENMVHIDQLIVAMVDMDEDKFEKVLGGLILRFGFERTITEVIYPFLDKIGLLWQTHNISPAQEHFISNLIRQKIIVAIDALPIAPKSTPCVLLYLPENEQHEIGLLFYHFLVRKVGYRTYYLGQNVPHSDLISVYKTHAPVILITSLTTAFGKIERYIEQVANDFPSAKILISGFQVQHVYSTPSHVTILRKAGDLRSHL